MSNPQCGLTEEKKIIKTKLHITTQKEDSLQRGVGDCLTGGRNLDEFIQIDQLYG